MPMIWLRASTGGDLDSDPRIHGFPLREGWGALVDRLSPPPWILEAGSWSVGGVCAEGSGALGTPGLWILESVGAVGLGVHTGSGTLDSGFWKLWAVGLGVRAAARTLDSGFWKLGCRRVDRAARTLDSGFCHMCMCTCTHAGGSRPSRGAGGFWILDSGFCRTEPVHAGAEGARTGFWMLGTVPLRRTEEALRAAH